MSSNRRFNVNDNLIARAVSGKGGDQRQHVSSDVVLEMERRKNGFVGGGLLEGGVEGRCQQRVLLQQV